jgi:hypothetical protein
MKFSMTHATYGIATIFFITSILSFQTRDYITGIEFQIGFYIWSMLSYFVSKGEKDV